VFVGGVLNPGSGGIPSAELLHGSPKAGATRRRHFQDSPRSVYGAKMG